MTCYLWSIYKISVKKILTNVLIKGQGPSFFKKANSELGIRYVPLASIYSIRMTLGDHETQFSQEKSGLNGPNANINSALSQ